MFKRLRMAVMVVAVVGAAASVTWLAMRGNYAERRLGSELLEIVDHPERVETYRVYMADEYPGEHVPAELVAEAAKLPADRMDGRYFLLLTPGATPSQADVEAAQRAVHLPRDPIDSSIPQPKCAMEPGFAIRFLRGGHFVDVLICWKCGHIGFFPDNHWGWVTHFSEDEPWAGIAKRALPGDAVIQSVGR